MLNKDAIDVYVNYRKVNSKYRCNGAGYDILYNESVFPAIEFRYQHMLIFTVELYPYEKSVQHFLIDVPPVPVQGDIYEHTGEGWERHWRIDDDEIYWGLQEWVNDLYRGRYSTRENIHDDEMPIYFLRKTLKKIKCLNDFDIDNTHIDTHIGLCEWSKILRSNQITWNFNVEYFMELNNSQGSFKTENYKILDEKNCISFLENTNSNVFRFYNCKIHNYCNNKLNSSNSFIKRFYRSDIECSFIINYPVDDDTITFLSTMLNQIKEGKTPNLPPTIVPFVQNIYKQLEQIYNKVFIPNCQKICENEGISSNDVKFWFLCS